MTVVSCVHKSIGERIASVGKYSFKFNESNVAGMTWNSYLVIMFRLVLDIFYREING